MPARAALPQAYEMFAALVSGSRDDTLSRPPYGCVATPELALDYLGISPQVLWSYKIRRQSPPIEKDAYRLYRGAGKKKTIYRYEAVLSWLPGGGDRPPWHWTRLWLHSIGEKIPDDPEAVLALVERLERDPVVRSRPYAFRKLDAGLARLRAAYGC